jgi:hypothetical protein
MIRGSCLCGAVTFEVAAATGPMETCHCNRCRKLSGSAAMTSVGVRAEEFRLLTGREFIRSYAAPILYAKPAYRSYFCGTCGSPLPADDVSNGFMEIPAGLLDDDPGLRPDKHIFVELLPAWDRIHDDLPRYTLRELVREREGRELPEDFQLRRHQPPAFT